ncbi:MAG: DUF2141 domain-containing protein [Deltaproteobacteria bacterium]|nr:DUF2141 domain-containing protein [Deltaproteobacteria bacterium]
MHGNKSRKISDIISQLKTEANTGLGVLKIILIIIVIWGVFSFLSDGTFLSARNLSNLFRQITIVGTMSIGLLMVMATGNIDLSVGVIAGYTSFLAASMSNVFLQRLPQWYPILKNVIPGTGETVTFSGLLSTLISFVFCVGFGALAGLFQGGLVAWLGIPSFITTLCGAMILGNLIGLAMMGGESTIHEKTLLYVGQGSVHDAVGLAVAMIFITAFFYFALRDRKQKRRYHLRLQPLGSTLLKCGFVSALVMAYVLFVANSYMGFQVSVLVMIGLAVAVSSLLFSTVFGRYCLAVGDNRQVAAMSGVNVRKVIVQAFVICGAICGISGFVLAGYSAGGMAGGPTASYDAIIACFIGLIAFGTHRGLVWGALAGAIIIGSIDCFMVLIDAKPPVQLISRGVLLIAVAYVAGGRGLALGSYMQTAVSPISLVAVVKRGFQLLPSSFGLDEQTYPSTYFSIPRSAPRTVPWCHLDNIKRLSTHPAFIWSGLFLLAAVFYLSGISHESLWCDEAFSANIADYSVWDIFKSASVDVHPPLFYLLLKIFQSVLGESEFALRLLSVAGALGLIVLGAGPVTRLFGQRTAVIYAVIIVFTPITLIMAHEARMYSVAMCTVTASALYALLAIKENRTADWVKWGIFSLASAYLHYFALLAVFFIHLFIIVWVFTKHGALRKRILMESGICALLYLPWGIVLMSQVARVKDAFWVMPFEGVIVLMSLLQTYYYKNLVPFEGIVFFLGLLTLFSVTAIIFIALIKSFVNQEKQRFTVLFYLVFIYGATLLFAVLVSVVVKPILYPRYMMVCTGLLSLALALGVSHFKRQWFRIAAVVVFALLNLTTIRNVYVQQFNGAFRDMQKQLNIDIKPGDLVVTSDCHCVSPALHYLPFAHHFFFVNSIEKRWAFTFDAMRPKFIDATDIESVLKQYKSFWIIKGGIGLSVDAEEMLANAEGWEMIFEKSMNYNEYSLNTFSVRKYEYTGKPNPHDTRGDLVVKISNIRKLTGTLSLFVLNKVFKEKYFLDELRRSYNSKVVRVENSELTYTFKNLPYGEYAVAVLQDENNNHMWDININGQPEEAYGVSNYDPLSLEGIDFVFGKIKFDFHRHRQQLDIKMNYPPKNWR